MLRRLNLSLRAKLYFKIFLFIILLPFVFHIMACLWNAVSSDSWISPIFWLDGNQISKTKLFSYFEAFHYTLISGIAGGDMGAVSVTQLIIASIIFIFG